MTVVPPPSLPDSPEGQHARLTPRCVPVSSLTPAQINAMWRCFTAAYTDVSEAAFRRDLAAKQDVILLEEEGASALRGFSTLVTSPTRHAGKGVVVVYSGDTVIDAGYWGQTALQSAFFAYIVAVKRKNSASEVYWHLISKGYKTYLLLARNFPNFWPRNNTQTPQFEAGLLDQLCSHRFGDAWDAARGTLQFSRPSGRLHESVAPVPKPLLADPDVAFFVRANPGHAGGEELCCLGKIDEALIQSYGRKLRALQRQK